MIIVDASAMVAMIPHKSNCKRIIDCFAYAVAKSRNAAILFADDDFVHTDLTNALG